MLAEIAFWEPNVFLQRPGFKSPDWAYHGDYGGSIELHTTVLGPVPRVCRSAGKDRRTAMECALKWRFFEALMIEL